MGGDGRLLLDSGDGVIDLALSREQELVRDSFRSLFEKEAGPQLVREAEPLGFSERLWQQMLQMGAAEIGLPEDTGGGGGGLLDAALLCELCGEFLAPVPVIETIAALRLLARLDGGAAGETLREALSSPSVTTLALSPPAAGDMRWVPAGAVAERVLAFDGGAVVCCSGPPPLQAETNLGSLPLAHRALRDPLVLATGAPAREAWRAALEEWKVLAAAWLAGAARRALDLALAYTKERKAFGAPIASYQSVAHRLADLATAVDGMLLLEREAAWAADRGSLRRRELALMASAFASETAEVTATEALHFHGGYGFMLEYDIQLYLTRIKAVSLLGGDPARDLLGLADEIWGSPQPGEPVDRPRE